jgi:cell division protein FtsQ
VAFRAPDRSLRPSLESLETRVELGGESRFIVEKEVLSLVANAASKDKTINIRLLEEQLAGQNGVLDAEVFSSLGKVLYVRIDQRVPLIRLFENGSSRYLDREGVSIDPSPHFSARVPVVFGDLPQKSRKLEQRDRELAELFASIARDSLLANRIDGGSYREGELWLHSAFGHEVRLGKSRDFAPELSKLNQFYTRFGNSARMQNIKTLDLRFEGQVVARTINP